MSGKTLVVSRASRLVLSASTAITALALPTVAWSQPNASPTTVEVAPRGTSEGPTAVTGNPNGGDTTNIQTPPATSDVGGIVVTARRAAESLQNVPVSVQVVTGDTIKKLAITNATEISKLAPGLTLATTSPDNPTIILRGVRWAPGSGTPAIPIYFNEAPFDPSNTIQSIFDVGQIEVLRGPQGTTRGAPSIAGAVTITTRKPDLEEIGGYIEGQYGEGHTGDAQGAVNAPLIKGMLAVRFAGDYQSTELNRVDSLNNALQPQLHSSTERLSVLFKPTDTLTIEGMYQRRRQVSRSYTQVIGTGSPGLAALGIPANFNGPVLTAENRKSLDDSASYQYNSFDLATINASWNVAGQVISYNFGRQIYQSKPNLNANDFANVAPGYDGYGVYSYAQQPFYQTNELRVSSETNPGRPFDYDVGWFSKHSDSRMTAANTTLLPGALGAPYIALPGQVTTPDTRYTINSLTNIGLGQRFDSFYGNLRVHIDRRTELSGGFSIIRDRVPVSLNVTVTPGLVAFPRFLPAASGGCPSALLPNSVAYGANYCDVSVQTTIPPEANNKTYSKAIYNFSLSHRFSDELLAYATTGSSYRSGLPAIGNDGLPSNLEVPSPETAKSYEVGLKTNVGRMFRFNADIFQINYKNQLTEAQGITYFNTVSQGLSQTGVAFYTNLDARVRGAEAELSIQPLKNLSIGGNISYSKITSRGGSVACNDASRPITALNPIDFCASAKGQTINSSSPFQMSANGSYEVPVGPVDAYFRFNVSYQNKNPNFGTSDVPTPAYALVDLFAGVTGNQGQWELGVFAKNAFNKQVVLASTAVVNSVYALFAAPTGYSQVNTNLPREVGVLLRYSFGSH